MRNCGIARFERLDALGERLERKIGVGTNHARERTLEGKARIGRRLELGGQIAENAEQPRQTVGPEQFHLADKFPTGRFAHLERRIGARKREHVHVANVFG